MTGVGASRLQSSGMRPLAASTSAAARENSRPRKRVSWPRITTGLRLRISDFGFRISELRKSAMPWVARRTSSKVKSRAISPRQPLVPNLMAAMVWFVDALGLVQKQLRILRHVHPHPLPAPQPSRQAGGPLPSDGRGRIVLRRSAYPTALEAASDGSGCSLSRRTGAGQGAGRDVRITPPVRDLLLHTPCLLRGRP